MFQRFVLDGRPPTGNTGIPPLFIERHGFCSCTFDLYILFLKVNEPCIVEIENLFTTLIILITINHHEHPTASLKGASTSATWLTGSTCWKMWPRQPTLVTVSCDEFTSSQKVLHSICEFDSEANISILSPKMRRKVPFCKNHNL